MKKYLLRIFLPVMAALLLTGGVMAALGFAMASSRTDQYAAERYTGENIKYEQLSAIFPRGSYITRDTVMETRYKVDAALISASISSPNESARLTVDAYSGEASMLLSTNTGTASVSMTAVGGDFFLFHPQKLVCGGYFSDSDVADDKIIIDTETAWKLFGSTNVAGMTVNIGNTSCIVSAVIGRKEGDFALAAYGESYRAYIPYSFYERNFGDVGISCYEMLIPTRIIGFGSITFSDNINIGDGTIVNNTGRFSPLRLLPLFGKTGERLMQTDSPAMPPWENEARAAEYYVMLYTVFATIAFASALLLATVTVIIILATGHYFKKLKILIDRKFGYGRGETDEI